MRLAIAQTRPFMGDIARNVAVHVRLSRVAATHGADLVIFPELSLTGYSTTHAAVWATTFEDERFEPLQSVCDAQGLVIGAGVPLQTDNGITISMLWFQPGQPREVYSKRYLHADEVPFFACGVGSPLLEVSGTNVALAVCYELSVPEHAAAAHAAGADVYVTSVAKYQRGVDRGVVRLAEIARTFAMPVVMANCLGLADGEPCVGQSAAWDARGRQVGQLDAVQEGVLIYDLATQAVCAMLDRQAA